MMRNRMQLKKLKTVEAVAKIKHWSLLKSFLRALILIDKWLPRSNIWWLPEKN